MNTGCYDVFLDGQPLTAISPYIHIANVSELTPERSIETAARPCSFGSWVLNDHLNSLGVKVQFAILTSDYALRKDICSRVAQWAQEGQFLAISDRPNQRLQVRCTALPVIDSAQEWGKLLSMTFTAYPLSFWEADSPVTVRSTSVSASHTLHLTPVGNQRETYLDFTITAASNLSEVTVSANGYHITFANLSMKAGDELVVEHVRGILIANIVSGTSKTPCLANRTTDSSDEVIVFAGKGNETTVRANASVTAVISATGRYL